jgi:hypothetical protein
MSGRRGIRPRPDPQRPVGLLLFLALGSTATPALAAGTNDTVGPQLVALVNQDRIGAGLAALTVDPRLTLVAQARAQYMLQHGFFSHCTGGEADTSCPLSGDDFVPRGQAAGIGVQTPGTTVAENLALNNFAATAAAQTNTAPLASPEHRANIMDRRLTGPTTRAFAANGDAQQPTTTGLMAWRKLDNWTAFTDGYRTRINGPAGLAKRPNTRRFAREANPGNLPLAR